MVKIPEAPVEEIFSRPTPSAAQQAYEKLNLEKTAAGKYDMSIGLPEEVLTGTVVALYVAVFL